MENIARLLLLEIETKLDRRLLREKNFGRPEELVGWRS